MAKEAIPMNLFQPSRISSEVPEAVCLPQTAHLSLSTQGEPLATAASAAQSYKDTATRSSVSWGEFVQEELTMEDLQEQKQQVSSMVWNRTAQKDKWRRRRLLVKVVAVLVALLIGGGIGGGVGATIGKSLASHPTITITAPNSTPTTIVDYAGCPSVNKLTYTSPTTNKVFLQLCGSEIVAVEGQNIDMGKEIRATFNECLEACAQLEGCVGATWYIFSAANPTKNSMCFFKDERGIASSGMGMRQQVASGVLQS